MWPFKWKLLSSTFLWWCLFFSILQNAILDFSWIMILGALRSERVKISLYHDTKCSKSKHRCKITLHRPSHLHLHPWLSESNSLYFQLNWESQFVKEVNLVCVGKNVGHLTVVDVVAPFASCPGTKKLRYHLKVVSQCPRWDEKPVCRMGSRSINCINVVTPQAMFTLGARALVPGHRHKWCCLHTLSTKRYRHVARARVLAWVLEKRCVHISAQRESYSGTVLGHQVWTQPQFPKLHNGESIKSSGYKFTIQIFRSITYRSAAHIISITYRSASICRSSHTDLPRSY